MQKPPFDNNNNTTQFLIKLITISKFIGIKLIVIPLVDNSSIKNNYNQKNN